MQLATTIQNVRRLQSRSIATERGGKSLSKNESDWQQRSNAFPADKSDEYMKFPMVTAKDLRGRKARPRKVRMLMRDFIEGWSPGFLSQSPVSGHPLTRRAFASAKTDSLYNPNYGYFSKQVVIFSPGEPFNFPSLDSELQFHSVLSKRYTEFEDDLDAAEVEPSDTRQLWYTPTELFRPYYGEAIARYLVANYRLTTYPYHDLIIYEMGAGRGTLMLNILDYIRDMDPEVYERTKFKIIEISNQLATLQGQQVQGPQAAAASRGHADRVEIINQSIFDWTQPVPSPCFFLAFEVFDNFAHDVVRYDLRTEEPLQGVVLIDGEGDFYEFYTPQPDPVAARFFRVRDAATGGRYRQPYPANRLARWYAANRPFAPNLSAPEYIPTRLMQFFDVLSRYFPKHRLLTSDFHSLPGAIPGLNAPIVQTRYQRRPVPVTTPLVSQRAPPPSPSMKF